jgi:hypothetical protein
MSEVLDRECNAAIPEVDVGQDVFAFRDDREEVARIQVKTARAEPYKKEEGYAARFGIPMSQLTEADEPELFYVLAVRHERRWVEFVVIRRSRVKELWNGAAAFASENDLSGDLELRLQFRPGSVLCGEVDLQEFRGAWSQLPPLVPAPTATEGPG